MVTTNQFFSIHYVFVIQSKEKSIKCMAQSTVVNRHFTLLFVGFRLDCRFCYYSMRKEHTWIEASEVSGLLSGILEDGRLHQYHTSDDAVLIL